MKRLSITLLAVVPVTIAAVAAMVYFGNGTLSLPFIGAPVPETPHVARCREPNTARHYLGAVVYKPQQVHLPKFVRATGVRPSMIEYYVEFGSTLDLQRAASIYRASAFPIVQVDPYHASLKAIADGRYDSYLRTQASRVREFSCPLAISFGHEMNGFWYNWGSGHVSPAVFIAAWRRIHTIFTTAGARNVVWLWTVNRVSPSAPLLKAWWPGARYVTWIGIDGYYRKPGRTFTSLFGKTLQELRAFSGKPVLLTETAVSRNSTQTAMITDLFHGARRSGVFAVVWFDVNALQKWTLESRPAPVLAAFHQEVVWYTR